MYKLLAILIILATLLVPQAPAFAGALSEKSDNCGPSFSGSVTTQAKEVPIYAWSGSGANQSESPPAPENPVEKVCENGAVKVEVRSQMPYGQSPRHFAYRIGDVIEVTVTIVADNDIALDLSTLTEQKIIDFEGSAFLLAKEPEISTTAGLGTTTYVIRLSLQTFAAAPYLPFDMDIRYATEQDLSGDVDTWKRLSTPRLYITFSQTADQGERLRDASLSPQESRRPVLALVLLTVGAVLLSGWSIVELVWLLSKRRPGRKLTAAEESWLAFDSALSGTPSNEAYGCIAVALRRYLEVDSESMAEIRQRYEHDRRLPSIESVFEAINRPLYQGTPLSESERKSLVECLEQIVPRPFDPRVK